MKQLKIRSMSTSLFVGLISLLTICIVLPIIFYFATIEPNEPALDYTKSVIVFSIIVLYCIPLVFLLLYTFYHFTSYVIVTSEGINICNPFKRNVFVHKDSISAYGTIFRGPRDTRIYFCTASNEKVLQFYYVNQDSCKKLFRNGLFQKYEKTEHGRWFMAVGTYVFSNPNDVYFIMSGSTKRLDLIYSVLQCAPLNIRNF